MDFLTNPVALTLIFIVSTARTARFVTYDDFPPMEWSRNKLAVALGATWSKVLVCPFCVTPYLTAGNLLWFAALYPGLWGDSQDTFLLWWVLPNLWWAISYAAAIVTAYDQPE